MEFNDDDALFIVLVGTLFFMLLVGFVFAAIYLYKRRQMEYLNEQTIREQTFSEEMLRTQLELTEKIMRTISEEIHDNIGQSLTVAKLSLNAMSDSDYAKHADTAREMITRSLHDLRNLSKTLNGDYILREGIQNAVERELKLIDQLGEIECELKGHFEASNLGPDREIILYRCIQEAISNALKHAEAKKIWVSADHTDGKLIVVIFDDGIGFKLSESVDKGVGMASMKKRIELIGGEIQIKSKPTDGTMIEITIPSREPKSYIG